jgi:hypothetical protein
MPAGTEAVGLLSQGGVGFPLAAAVGLTLLAAALALVVQAVRVPRSPLVAAGCLLGAVGVLAQLALVTGDPASRVAYLSGLLGASCWYGTAVRLLAERVTGAARQWLAVGSLLWVGGTVSITTTAAPADWPLGWALLFGLGLAGSLAALLLRRSQSPHAWTRGVLVLSGVLVAPAPLGLLVGEEALFVGYLLVFAVSVVCWSLVRLALDQTISTSRVS